MAVWEKVATFAAVFISKIPKYRQRPDRTIEKYDYYRLSPDFGDASPCSCVRLLVLFLLFVEDGLDVEERFNQQMFFSEE